MHLNVSQLMREPSGSTRHHTLDDTVVSSEGVDEIKIVADVKLMRTLRGVWISVKAGSDVRCTCARCLAEYLQPIRITIEEEALLSEDVSAGLIDFDEADAPPLIDENRELDLSDILHQYASIATPMQPICREDCKGLCELCGINLNEMKCECNTELRDPRWDVLREVVSVSES